MYDLPHLRRIQFASIVCNKPPANKETRTQLNSLWGVYCIVGPRGGLREELYEGFGAATDANRNNGQVVLVRAAYAESAEDDARPRFEALFPGNEDLVRRLMWLHGRAPRKHS